MPQYVMILRSHTAEFIELEQIVNELCSPDVTLSSTSPVPVLARDYV